MNFRQILIFSIGPIGSALIGLITVPFIAWFYSSEDVARVAMLQTVLSLCVILATLGLDQSYIREVYDSKNKEKLFLNCFFPGLLICITIAIFFLCFDMYSVMFDLNNTGVAVYTIILSIGVEFFNRFISVVLRMDGRSVVYSFVTIFPKMVFLAAVFSFSILDEAEFHSIVYSYFIAHAISFVIGLYVYKGFLNQATKENIDWIQIRPLFRYGTPLLLSGVCFWGITGLDRIMLKEMSELKQLAYFSTAFNFAAAGFVLQAVFSVVWAPIVYKWATEESCFENVEKTLKHVFLAVSFIYCGAGVFSPVVIFILPEEYSIVPSLIVCCMAYPLMYTLSEVTSIGINITKKTKWNIVVTVISLAINFFANYILIPLWGAVGAAIATCLTFYMYMILRSFVSNLIWRKMRLLSYYIALLLFNGTAITFAWLGAGHSVASTIVWFLIFVTVVLVFVRKDDWNSIKSIVDKNNA